MIGITDLIKHVSTPSSFAELMVIDPPQWTQGGELGIAFARRFVEDVRKLPRDAAMWDGRKWSGIPIAVVQYGTAPDAALREALMASGVAIIDSRNMSAMAGSLHGLLEDYRSRLMSDYDRLGFHVVEDNGMFYVNGLAIKMRKGKESELYNGDADMRIGRMFVLRRNPERLGREIDELQELINQPKLPEPELQRFLEQNPHFITDNIGRAIPHPRLPTRTGQEEDIPDFAVVPYGPLPRDTDFEILEIKRADEKLIVKKRRGVRKVSAELAYGISQLRQARKSLQDPRNEELVANTLGRAVKHPRLGLIIGRTPDDEELLELDEQQSFYPDVRITTSGSDC